MSSVHWEKSMRPSICRQERVFSMADVILTAWKLPPWWMVWPRTSTRGLSVVELHSMETWLWARVKSSSWGPIHWEEVRRA